MHIYHARQAQHIKVAPRAIKAWLEEEQGCTRGFIVDLSIILLAEGTEEAWLKKNPPLGPTVVLSVGPNISMEQLDQELIRKLILERLKSPWGGKQRRQDGAVPHFFSLTDEFQPLSVTVFFG